MRLPILALLLLTSQSHAEEFVIDEYRFEWEVEDAGDYSLAIVKTHDSTVVAISGNSSYLTMPPAAAEEVGKSLADTEAIYRSMRGSKEDVSKEVEAGEYTVTFRQSVQYGFSVVIAEKGTFSLGRIHLERKEARAFAPHLRKAKAMADFLDQKLDSVL